MMLRRPSITVGVLPGLCFVGLRYACDAYPMSISIKSVSLYD